MIFILFFIILVGIIGAVAFLKLGKDAQFVENEANSFDITEIE
jgi:hypothetical protein